MSEIQRQRDGSIEVVALRGEHDLNTVGALERALSEALAGDATCLLDLSEATFIDSAVIAVLLRFSKEAQASEREALAIVIGDSSSVPARTLALVGLVPRLPLFTTRDLASAALRDGRKPRAERPVCWLSDRELEAAATEARDQSARAVTADEHGAADERLDAIDRERRARRDD